MPKDVLEHVTEHIKRSPLYNPYTEGSFILKWAIYKHQARKGILDVDRGQRTRKENEEEYESRNILEHRAPPPPYTRAPDPPLPAITPSFYRDLGGTNDFDHYIPKWNINLGELQELYDEARFKRYLKWSTKSFQPNRRWSAWKKLCYRTAFKRRIPWLYPYDGKFFL